MEQIVKEPSSAAGRSTSRLLRYPLRSASKAKEEKPPVTDAPKSSASRTRASVPSTVSKSVGVLDLSGKEKSAKPPRRMSIPTKSSASPAPKLVGNITPISETRAKKFTTNSVKSDTPVSDVSKSATRRNFSRLSSAPYWVSQIKLSESAGKHSISLGFFRLALEAECENPQLLRDELKTYARRHNLAEFGESLKELFESYNILEKLDQLQVSETCSFVPEYENRSSDDDVLSSSTVKSIEKPNLKPLNVGSTEVYQVKDANKETNQKISSNGTAELYQVKGMKKDQKNDPPTKTRKSARTNAMNLTSGLQSGGGNTQKKPQKPRKKESNKARDKVKQQGNKSSDEEGPIVSPPAEKSLQENKENMDAAEELSSKV